jgi:fructose-bisphosphate aldolase class 1
MAPTILGTSARALVAAGEGILGRRFEQYGIASGQENRRRYRQMLFSLPGTRCPARALQAAPLRTWAGDPARAADAQRAFHHRARCNRAARSGAYTPELERRAT